MSYDLLTGVTLLSPFAGHLKEQDHLIDLMQRLHETHTCEEVMAKVMRDRVGGWTENGCSGGE